MKDDKKIIFYFVQVVGWGVTKEGDPFSSSNMLMKADIQLINRNDCINEVPREFTKFVSATKFCVKGVRSKLENDKNRLA